MAIVLLHAGELAEPRDLQACLREIHEDARTAALADIQRRTVNGTLHKEPIGPTKDPGPYVHDAALDGICVRARVLAEKRRSILDATHSRALLKYLKAVEAGAGAAAEDADPVAIAEMTNAIFDARRTYVGEAIAGIDGVDGVQTVDGGMLSESTLDALERAHLINPLFSVAQHLQGLDAKKAERFGRSPASTSPASTAPSVQSIAIAPAGVMEGAATSTAIPTSSPATATQPTHAHGGT